MQRRLASSKPVSPTGKVPPSPPSESSSIVMLHGKEPETLQSESRRSGRKNVAFRLMLALSMGIAMTIAMGFSGRFLWQQRGPRESPEVVGQTGDEVKKPDTKPTPTPEVTPVDWNLPGVDEMEEGLPPTVKEGKELLADLIAVSSESDELSAVNKLPSEEQKMLATVAKVITHGETDRLIGARIVVENVREYAKSGVESPPSLRLKITKFIGSDHSRIVVQAVDEDTDERFCLRISAHKVKNPDESLRSAARTRRQVMKFEEETWQAASGGSSAAVAASQRGLAIPLLTADIAGVGNVTRVENIDVFKQVELTESIEGDLSYPLFLLQRKFSRSLPAKEYIAHRLLLQTLHLQAAEVSHNDLHWGNCLVRSDGSFLLGGLDYGAPFGASLHEMTRLNVFYAEPQLLAEFNWGVQSGDPVESNSKCDMWSLGVLLFELFTDESFPEDMAEGIADGFVVPDDLLAQMTRAGAPPRWAELTVQLLSPHRVARITGREVGAEFGDLVRPQ